jgi:hypothetical protein
MKRSTKAKAASVPPFRKRDLPVQKRVRFRA